jgi:hypothetical protein
MKLLKSNLQILIILLEGDEKENWLSLQTYITWKISTSNKELAFD